MAKVLKPEDVTTLVLQLKDVEHMSWAQVVKEFAKRGIVSGRTKEPLQVQSLRNAYYAAKRPMPSDIDQHLTGGKDPDLFRTLVRTFLKTPGVSDKDKLRLIEQALTDNG